VEATPKRRALRADAERNRQRVLEIAQEVFAADGLSVPIDEVARRAGLGIGTVYRHFPTKEALLEAIVVDRMRRVTERAEELATADEAGAAFFAFLEMLVEESRKKKDLVHALGSGFEERPLAVSAKKKFRGALGALLSRAQRARDVRGDVDVADVLSLIRGLLSSSDPRAQARHLGILCDGLRPHR
jgi:AcrR family transcriptional regulator